jgi:glyoxylase-like metal-dependent hydrolase (beta-lactamase superfamily II)
MVEYYGAADSEYYQDWKSLLEKWVGHIISDYHIDSNFTDGVPIDCGTTKLIPIHLPGHTIDHTGFGIDGLDTLFLVDIDLTRFGPWYGNSVSDIWYFKRSIEIAMELEPEKVITSHLLNPVTEGIQDRFKEYLEIFDKREKRILENIKQGYDTVKELASVPTIYPRIPFNAYLIFEEIMIEKHLESMIKDEIIYEENGRYCVKE